MKKVSLITIHLGSNFGSILQTIATVVVLKKHCFDVEVVNYIPDRCTWRYFFKNAIKSPILFIKSMVLFPIELINKRIYNGFLSKYVKVSKPIYSDSDFEALCPKADVYMTGSDQVWNSIHNNGLDVRYYFGGFLGGVTKVSYASSFGREALDGSEYLEVKRMLSEYKAISVREKSAKLIVESMGYHATHLLDPTFMLDKVEWQSYKAKRIVKEPYIIVYLPYNVHDKDLIYKSVRKIADLKKLKVVSFTWSFIPEKLSDRTIFFASPGQFLTLMDDAEYVITNSFHGTAFSINLNKQFSVYLPTGFGTRIMSILELCSLTDRILGENEIISNGKIETVIDYTIVNAILDKERINSHVFLNKALND